MILSPKSYMLPIPVLLTGNKGLLIDKTWNLNYCVAPNMQTGQLEHQNFSFVHRELIPLHGFQLDLDVHIIIQKFCCAKKSQLCSSYNCLFSVLLSALFRWTDQSTRFACQWVISIVSSLPHRYSQAKEIVCFWEKVTTSCKSQEERLYEKVQLSLCNSAGHLW